MSVPVDTADAGPLPSNFPGERFVQLAGKAEFDDLDLAITVSAATAASVDVYSWKEIRRLLAKLCVSCKNAEHLGRVFAEGPSPLSLRLSYDADADPAIALTGGWVYPEGREALIYGLEASIAEAERRLSALLGSEIFVQLVSRTRATAVENPNYRPFSEKPR